MNPNLAVCGFVRPHLPVLIDQVGQGLATRTLRCPSRPSEVRVERCHSFTKVAIETDDDALPYAALRRPRIVALPVATAVPAPIVRAGGNDSSAHRSGQILSLGVQPSRRRVVSRRDRWIGWVGRLALGGAGRQDQACEQRGSQLPDAYPAHDNRRLHSSAGQSVHLQKTIGRSLRHNCGLVAQSKVRFDFSGPIPPRDPLRSPTKLDGSPRRIST